MSSISLFGEVKLSSPPVDTTIDVLSTEQLMPTEQEVPSTVETTEEISNEILDPTFTSGPDPDKDKTPYDLALPFTTKEDLTIVFLGGLAKITPSHINMFLTLTRALTSEHRLLVHAPVNIPTPMAFPVYNALKDCKAHVTVSAPYIQGLAAAIIPFAADKIMTSPYGLMQLSYPDVKVAGGVLDARNGLEYLEEEWRLILQVLIDEKIITEQDYKKIFHEQSVVTFHTKKLQEMYEAYNARQSQG